MVVLAIAALAAAVTTASAFGVRAFVLEKSFVGLPPEGAIPSSPEHGKLVLDYIGPGRREGKNGKMKSWLFADGRRIWIQNTATSSSASRPRESSCCAPRPSPPGTGPTSRLRLLCPTAARRTRRHGRLRASHAASCAR